MLKPWIHTYTRLNYDKKPSKEVPPIKITSAQDKILQSDGFFILIGGEPGSGKSFVGLTKAVTNAHIPHYQSLIVRQKLNEFSKAITPALKELCEGYDSMHFMKTANRWEHKGSGGCIQYQQMAHSNDINSIKGTSYDFALIDEITAIPRPLVMEIWNRMRGKGKGINRQVYATFNTFSSDDPREASRTNWLLDIFLRDHFLDKDLLPIYENSGKKLYFLTNTKTKDIQVFASESEAMEVSQRWSGYSDGYLTFQCFFARASDNPFLSNAQTYKAILTSTGAIEATWALKDAIFAETDFTHYTDYPSGGKWFATMDTASGSAKDFTVLGVWYFIEKANYVGKDWFNQGALYLIDMIRIKTNTLDQGEAIKELLRPYKDMLMHSYIFIENANIAVHIRDLLMLEGYKTYLVNRIKIKTDTSGFPLPAHTRSKLVRAQMVAPFVKNKRVFLPELHAEKTKNIIPIFLREVSSFNQYDTAENDDITDTLIDAIYFGAEKKLKIEPKKKRVYTTDVTQEDLKRAIARRYIHTKPLI